MLNYKEIKLVFEEKIKKSNQVLITPHLRVDMDAIASSLALSSLVKKCGKPSFILLDEPLEELELGSRKMVEQAQNDYEIIDLNTFMKKQTSKDLLILSDVNKKNRIACSNILPTFQDIFIFDHHSTDSNTVDTEYQFIDTSISSASEMIAQLAFVMNLKISPRLAEYLLAGIALDTQNLTRAPSSAFKVSSKLMNKGTSIEAIEPYFQEDFASNRKWNHLVDKAEFQNYKAAVVIGDDQEIYTGVEIAKAASCLLNFDADATFVVGRISKEEVSISARSRGTIDVSSIMQEMSENGGGSPRLAAARIKNETTEEVGAKLKQKIRPVFYCNP